MYTGIKDAILASTSWKVAFPFKFLINPQDTNNKWVNINRLAPRTANLLGESPNSVSLNEIAESAIALAMIVNMANPSKMKRLIFEPVLFVSSDKENKMIAITPINKILNRSKKFRSL